MDFMEFGQRLVASDDVDPLYPFLRHIYAKLSLTDEQRLWFTFLYVASYNIASALWLFQRYPTVREVNRDVNGIPTGVERRGNRGRMMQGHINGFVRTIRTYGGIREWIEQGWVNDEAFNFHGWTADSDGIRQNGLYANYERFWVTSQTVNGNGRWATFKWAEILRKVHEMSLQAPDMRLKYSGKAEAKPARCMNLFMMPTQSSVKALDRYGEILRETVAERVGDKWDFDTLETILCNFHSMTQGHYYIGHDIDEMLHVINVSDRLGATDKRFLFEARATVFKPDYLGEFRGWAETSKALKRQYQKTGVIGDRFPT